MTVLVTGGTGFIGSHQVVALIEAGHDVVMVDNGSNSDVAHVSDHIAMAVGRRIPCHEIDIRDTDRLTAILRQHRVDRIMHFAAMKDLRESVERPAAYYANNLEGLFSVVDAANAVGARRLVFSSTGSVYGSADQFPITEDAPHRPTNPYSMTKSVGERMLADIAEADPTWRILALRYFNPAGAHHSGFLGEAPTRRRTNLLPILLDVASGEREVVDIFGADFPTHDGTGVRDYVHVMDVAAAHIAALDRLETTAGFDAFNVGRGEGVSVRQLITACEAVTARPVPFRLRDSHPGDVARLVGCTERSSDLLGMSSYRSINEIVEDAWRWHLESNREASCWADTTLCQHAS